MKGVAQLRAVPPVLLVVVLLLLSSLQSAFAADTGRIRVVLKDTTGEPVMNCQCRCAG